MAHKKGRFILMLKLVVNTGCYYLSFVLKIKVLAFAQEAPNIWRSRKKHQTPSVRARSCKLLALALWASNRLYCPALRGYRETSHKAIDHESSQRSESAPKHAPRHEGSGQAFFGNKAKLAWFISEKILHVN